MFYKISYKLKVVIFIITLYSLSSLVVTFNICLYELIIELIVINRLNLIY